MSLNSDIVTTTSVTNSAERILGLVKWFNNKSGYGFITVVDGEKSGSDIFVHHTTINVSNEQYKYLVQGEYVEFSLVKVENSTHEYQAINVCGIKGGRLMCETRRELKLARNNYKSTDEVAVERDYVRMPRQQRIQSTQSTQSSCVVDSKPEPESNSWTVVPNKSYTSKQPSQGKPSTSGRGRGRPPRSVN
jgi:cold shock CspA family protein